MCASDQTERLVKKEETPVSAPDSVAAVLVWPQSSLGAGGVNMSGQSRPLTLSATSLQQSSQSEILKLSFTQLLLQLFQRSSSPELIIKYFYYFG